ncbi:hypothetical protein [Sphingomonas sp. MA1305]|uniref:hypothetical protein n=1 Tax=Sphingomonas sp. MA1305 TaxID=2479204 RepID=UPI003FA6A3F8
MGGYPDLSLDQARARNDDAAAARARGDDPRVRGIAKTGRLPTLRWPVRARG